MAGVMVAALLFTSRSGTVPPRGRADCGRSALSRGVLLVDLDCTAVAGAAELAAVAAFAGEGDATACMEPVDEEDENTEPPTVLAGDGKSTELRGADGIRSVGNLEESGGSTGLFIRGGSSACCPECGDAIALAAMEEGDMIGGCVSVARGL
jgi:hypothetical protein